MPNTKAYVAVAGLLASSVLAQNPPIDPNFFPNLPSSDTLTWVSCYGTFQCAKLNVPANVNNPGNEKVQIAIAKIPAISGKKNGTLVFQTGGFSGSNTNFIIQSGMGFGPLYPDHDVIGIDRRGTGWSTPSLRCFGSEEERKAWVAAEPAVLGSSDEALVKQFKRAQDFGANCKKYGGEAAEWMGTYPSTVDIHTVMKAIGETKISFHGISSGTHTAQTFAMLYPEAVDKFTLDAVVRSPLQYTKTDSLPDSSMDGELVLDGFFQTCMAAKQACPFAGNSTTPKQLRKRYEDLDWLIKRQPVGKFGWSELHQYVTAAVLDGTANFPLLAMLLVELENKQSGEGVRQALELINAPPKPLPQVDAEAPFDLLQAGVCLDAADEEMKTLDDFRPYLRQMLKVSPSTGGMIAKSRLYCMGWQVDPVNQIPKGLFDKKIGKRIAGQILYITTTADPLCPLSNAYYMSEKYFATKSIVVVDHALGHTSVATGTLSGTEGPGGRNFGIFEVMGTWYQTGKLAPADSVYLPDFPPFLFQGAGYVGQLASGFGSIRAPAFPVARPAWAA